MIIIIYVLLLVFVVGVAYVGIPADVRTTINENCRDSGGRLKLRYVASEARAVLAFYAQILVVATLLTFVLIVAVLMVDSYVFPLNWVKDAAEVAHVDADVGKDDLDSTNAKKNDNKLDLGPGGPWANARDSMQFLWHAIPFAVMLGFVVLVLTLRLTSQGYNNALSDIVTTEVARSRRRLTRHYLDSTAQTKRRGSTRR